MSNDLQESQRALEAAADLVRSLPLGAKMAVGYEFPSIVQAFAKFERDLLAEREGLREALDGNLGMQSGPNGMGGMRVVVHFPVGGEEKLFGLLSDAALKDNQP